MTEPTPDSLALLSVAEMAAADEAAIASGIAGFTLMERAGRAVADAVSRRGRPGERVLVLCGPGKNGGDGFVAANLLAGRGFSVTLALAGERGRLTGDAGQAASGWQGSVLAIAEAAPEEHDIVVDALFGAGLNRPIEGAVAVLVERVNAGGRPVVAVDVPSGVSGDSGMTGGPTIRADETVTFFRLKPGHLLYPGRALCGVVTLADIGITAEMAFGPGKPAAMTFSNEPALWQGQLPRHEAGTHKYRRGAVAVAAGGLSGVGAPRLGARAALRIGAGLATIICRPEALAAHAGRGPDALMQMAASDGAAFAAVLAKRKLSAVLAGPALGLDDMAGEVVTAALRSNLPLVLDADALTVLAARPELLVELTGRRPAPTVLTPHEGEFLRLFGDRHPYASGASRLVRARAAAAVTASVVVLKGPDSVIAAPDGRAAINATGSAVLATAGSGDVLGGIVAGLLAQGMPAFEAACAAVWLHGKAGEALGLGLIADDLPEALPALLRSV
ncbi:hypothetical protein DK26_05150 [Bosea sp. WAO]|uniref:bifunctional ADP-dependent NAD(P)H-hydrate dehydratase/NAD(P)H-hydrate epimerase n=1 Tax=Bosea sp. WAO TaxID=406341 RepID=UPI00074740E0|nr:bifunctional ADP-dependent NAD(P)H-hydrate dehydratase/NAD(P)H-hydrate epimerase [Bosea sp. WAO]KUL96255.1 hypothetical protein DK26_05150 [Bosea sp. WAO]